MTTPSKQEQFITLTAITDHPLDPTFMFIKENNRNEESNENKNKP